MSIVLLVLFVMTMFVWLLNMLGVFGHSPDYRQLLPWIACLWLGMAVFVTGPVVTLWRVP